MRGAELAAGLGCTLGMVLVSGERRAGGALEGESDSEALMVVRFEQLVEESS